MVGVLRLSETLFCSGIDYSCIAENFISFQAEFSHSKNEKKEKVNFLAGPLGQSYK